MTGGHPVFLVPRSRSFSLNRSLTKENENENEESERFAEILGPELARGLHRGVNRSAYTFALKT